MGNLIGNKTLEAQRALLESLKPQYIRPPRGVKFVDPAEKVLWSQFTAARSKADWRQVDLVMLVKVVQLQTQIDSQQEALDAEGYVIDGPKGGSFANPRCQIIHQMQTRQLNIMRALALTVIRSKGVATFNAERTNEAKKKIAGVIGKGPRMDLLA